MVVQLSYKSNVQNIRYLPYIPILWAPYTPHIHSAASSSMAQNYFLARSIPIHLGLDGSALVSMTNDRAQKNAAWYMALRKCCINESCLRGKFSSCRPDWAKSCRLHLFISYLVDAAWCIKQRNLLMVFISLSITFSVW